MPFKEKHTVMANAIRALAMDAVEAAKSGHPGLPMGGADVATVLFTRHLKFDPTEPNWPDRDRFVLSAGHGSMLIYAVLHLLGVDGVSLEELKHFRQMGSKTPGHPEYGHTPGIETTTGPLGQGLANAVGMAMAEEALRATWGKELVDHYTYVFASDGDLMEGISQEAIAFAGHQKLSRLIVLFDDNGISIDGAISLSDSTDQLKRFEASGWAVCAIDGHDSEAISAAITAAKAEDKPSLIACKTTIGYGAPKKAGTAKAHGEPLGADEMAGAKAALGWPYPAFEVPADIRDAWRLAGLKVGHGERKAWEKRFAALDADKRAEFDRRLSGTMPRALADAIAAVRAKVAADPAEVATRKSSEIALEAINAVLPEMLGGSADLSGSNNTRTGGMTAYAPGNRGGRYVHWGIREHGMAAAMNGIALHGGLLPYSGTFLAFSDYCRPALRLAALMGIRVVHVMTHDSIGLGEDGPTHQPVEHMAALRAIPNLLAFRPCDTIETAEAWECALRAETRPSVLALTRQGLPQLRRTTDPVNRVARGAYILADSDKPAVVCLFATGSEVHLAMNAKVELDKAGHPTRVVSVPCFELFFEQDADYRASVMGTARVRVGVEAAIRMGWDAIIGSDGDFVGMTGFGASAPAKQLYKHFGITSEAIVAKAIDGLKRNG
jgi:transketolase